MLRFWYVIIISLPYIIYYLAKGSYIEKNTERYSEADRYRVALHVIHVMKRNGRIRTSVTGVENLPAEGGYMPIIRVNTMRLELWTPIRNLVRL